MDAITLLKDDHKTVERLFKRFEKAGDHAYAEKRRITDQIIEELSKHAAIHETDALSWIRGHLPNGILEAQGVELTDISTEHARERSVAAWMGIRSAEEDNLPIRCDHRRRMPQHALDVVFADCEVNATAIAIFNKPQRCVGGVLDRAGLAAHARDFVEPLAGELRIPVASRDHDIPSVSSAAAIEKKSPGGLTPEEKQRLQETLDDLNRDVFGAGETPLADGGADGAPAAPAAEDDAGAAP